MFSSFRHNFCFQVGPFCFQLPWPGSVTTLAILLLPLKSPLQTTLGCCCSARQGI